MLHRSVTIREGKKWRVNAFLPKWTCNYWSIKCKITHVNLHFKLDRFKKDLTLNS
jgi:hypothetical protein